MDLLNGRLHGFLDLVTVGVFLSSSYRANSLSKLRCMKCPLFRGFAVEVFFVGFRLGTGMVDDAVAMIGRRVERIEL